MLPTKKDKKKPLEPGTIQNRINEGTKIKGDISSSGYFRVDGMIEGNIKTPVKIVLGKTGVIIGSLICEDADIEGTIEGNIEVSGTMILRSTAVIDGEVTVGKLAVEPGAIMNASCVMLNSGNPSEAKKITNKKHEEIPAPEVN